MRLTVSCHVALWAWTITAAEDTRGDSRTAPSAPARSMRPTTAIAAVSLSTGASFLSAVARHASSAGLPVPGTRDAERGVLDDLEGSVGEGNGAQRAESEQGAHEQDLPHLRAARQHRAARLVACPVRTLLRVALAPGLFRVRALQHVEELAEL